MPHISKELWVPEVGMARRKKLMVNGGRGGASLEAAGTLSHHLQMVSNVWMSRWLAARERIKLCYLSFPS